MKERKGASICSGEDETQRDGKVDIDEGGIGTVRGGGVINGTDELLAGYGGGMMLVQMALLMEISLT